MTGKIPTRRETNAKRAEVAAKMRDWIDTCRAKVADRNRLDDKARMLAGDDGGGSGVTLDMQRISRAAKARPVVRVFGHKNPGPNRAARRLDARRGPRVFDRQKGRWHRVMPPGRNGAYVGTPDPRRSDRA